MLGSFLNAQFGIVLPGTWDACVIAAFVISFPLMYRNARAAFEQVDVNLIYAGRTLGKSEIWIFGKLSCHRRGRESLQGQSLLLPEPLANMAPHPCLRATSWAGQVQFPNRLPCRWGNDNIAVAGFWTVLIILISILVVLTINLITGKRNKTIRRWE